MLVDTSLLRCYFYPQERFIFFNLMIQYTLKRDNTSLTVVFKDNKEWFRLHFPEQINR